MKKEKNVLSNNIDHLSVQIKEVKNDLKKVTSNLQNYQELKEFIKEVVKQQKHKSAKKGKRSESAE